MLFAFRALFFRTRRLPQWSSHQVLPALAFVLTAAALFSEKTEAGDPVDLRPATAAGSCRQAKVVVEVEGKLKLNADGQEIKHLPLKVHAELQYVERVLTSARHWSEVRLIRAYRTAEAKIRLHESELASELGPERRLIAVE